MFLSIFLDFRIWIYASVEVQQELLRLLKSHTLTKLPYYREMIGTQILLDVCRNFYWFKPDEHSFAVEPKFNLASSVSSITISQDDGEEVQSNNHQRPSEKHIKILRHQILEIFFEFVKESITFDETKSIVLYLQECQDERQLANLLQVCKVFFFNDTHFSFKKQIILSLQKTSQHIILKHLIALGGLEPFIALLNANNENVRLWSLKVIGKMLEQSHPKQKEQLLSGSITTVAIKKCLQQYKMTPATYFTLLEVLLENVSITALKNPLEGLDKDTALQFKNPGIISTIFELLCLTGGSDLQLRVLKEFENLLRQSSHNRTIFLEQHWQSWLFGLLANYTGGGLSTTPLKLRSDIFNSIIEIFTISHYHSISQV